MILLCYMELVICSFISIIENPYHQLKNNDKFIDKFSHIAAYVTLYILYIFPLLIILIIILYTYKYG